MRGITDIAGIAPAASVGTVARLQAIGDPGRDALARFARIELGSRFDALLLSRYDDGSFNVQFANAALRMNLPAGAEVGDRLKLTLVASEPRLTFQLQQDSAAVSASLSSAGKLVDALLHAQAGLQQPQAVLEANAPVLPAASDDAPALSTALRAVLLQSGLFYESHVAQWASGGRTLEELKREPQVRFGPDQLHAPGNKDRPEPGPRAVSARNAADAPVPFGWADRKMNAAAAAAGQLPASPIRFADDDGRQNPVGPFRIGTDTPVDGGPPAIDPESEAAQMIRLQLDTLEHRQLLWRGEPWPGLPMEWGIAEGEAGQPGQGGERAWQSVVRFHFNRLGTVAATISLEGGQLQIALRADSAEVTQNLREQAASLTHALDAAGTPLHLLTVRQEDES